MKKYILIAAVILVVFAGQRVRAQIHGESIFANPVASTNRIALPADAKTNSAAAPTNAMEGAEVGFDQLGGFPLRLTDELAIATNRADLADAQINAMIPAGIHALNQRKVSIEGFMVPLEFEKQKVVEFMLSQNPPACCFGSPPQIHEWVRVRVKSPGVEVMDYGVVRARGVLSVGPQRAAGMLTCIYSLEADAVEKISER